MLQRLFSELLPDRNTLLPIAAQQGAIAQIRQYWLSRGREVMAGELFLWAVVITRHPQSIPFAVLMAVVFSVYLITLLGGHTLAWVLLTLFVFLLQGMIIHGISAVTALSFLMPYTFAAMLLSGRRRVLVQMTCIGAFWLSLIYEAVPSLRQITLPGYLVVGYNILLAAYTFQTLRFLNQLAVDLNRTHVASEVEQRSQMLLARVSHELRTPLNSVLGFAKLVRRTPLSDQQQHYMDQIIEEGEQLNRLVSDLLDSAHLATGNLTLTLVPCDINGLCAAVVEEQQVNQPPEVNLRVTLAADMPPFQVDRVRLRQAVSNLVANAVKYTPRGEIHLMTRYEQLPEAHAAIVVQDTGVGIAEADQKLVFVPFVQLGDEGHSKRRIGAGLGLDIARQIVRLHHGDILLESKPGKGSTFTIVIPALA